MSNQKVSRDADGEVGEAFKVFRGICLDIRGMGCKV